MTNGQPKTERLDEIIEAAVAQGPGFSFLGDRGWGYGVSVPADGSHTWAGGLGTTWVNVPDQDLTVVLTQLAAGLTVMPAVCDEVLAAARVTP